jgi:hypothetical protein
MPTLVFAVEAWILSIMGWAWLTFQEMWAWSLLSAQVFYGFIWLSTCNVIASGIRPDSIGPRSAYFAVTLAFFLHSTCCIFDTVVAPQIGPIQFESPYNKTTCTLAKSQQILFFSDSPFYLAQAGITLGYLFIQLVLAGAAMLDTVEHTLWPGPTWALSLCLLLCYRFANLYDGTSSAIADKSRYVQLFALPILEFALLFVGFLYFLGIMLGVEGMPFRGVGWRKSARYVTFVGVLIFQLFSGYALFIRGFLTPGLIALFGLIMAVNLVSLAEGVRATPVPEVIRETPPPLPQPPRPFPPYYQQAPLGMQIPPDRSRFYIPSAVEMATEKNKGV